jgi:hypothetical protein
LAKRKSHTSEPIIGELLEAEVKIVSGTAVPLACKDLGVTEQTYYR